jgi:hypothetical protein
LIVGCHIKSLDSALSNDVIDNANNFLLLINDKLGILELS